VIANLTNLQSLANPEQAIGDSRSKCRKSASIAVDREASSFYRDRTGIPLLS
jgi:hypothetical protein